MSAKDSKCVFASDKVEYLGHFISAKGVETDPKKIPSIASWPGTLKDLRCFLGLLGFF